MTSNIPDGTILDGDLPNAKTQSFSFMGKLPGAWIAMRFRSPKIEGAGKLEA